ncbi:MAG: RNA polymerase sigma factor [Candidatus Omnitrophica bacterium]|nr:RNA polymerase sigma factor [Candidatus Omnitrophota bacterium]
MNPELDPDWLLVEQIKQGDNAAFNTIFEKHKRRVINLAYRFTKSRETSEDIAQDVFVKVYEGKLSAQANAKFSTWLYRVTVNAAIDSTRRRKFQMLSLHQPRVNPKTGEEAECMIDSIRDPKALLGSDVVCEAEIVEIMRREIDGLGEPLRFPLLLFQFENLSYREIGTILGISEKAVERRLHRAKEVLRRKLALRKIAL